MTTDRQAIQNLRDQYAPDLKLPRGGYAAYSMLYDHTKERGDELALDNMTGEFVIMRGEAVIARSRV